MDGLTIFLLCGGSAVLLIAVIALALLLAGRIRETARTMRAARFAVFTGFKDWL